MNAPHLEKEEVLKLLEKIHSTNETSQRVLSRDLNISLGKTNFLIRELINKGLVKIKKFKNDRSKLGYLYILTPQGIRQKTLITIGFLKKKTEEYDKLRQEIQELKEVIKNNHEFSEFVKQDGNTFDEK